VRLAAANLRVHDHASEQFFISHRVPDNLAVEKLLLLLV
jgi:hypothetical protein